MSYRFSGHQTFVFRCGWLVKGVDLIRRNPHGFLEDDAIVHGNWRGGIERVRLLF